MEDIEQRLPVIMFGSKEQLKIWAEKHEENFDDLVFEAGMTRFFKECGFATARFAEFLGDPYDETQSILDQVDARLRSEADSDVKAIVVKVRKNLEVLQCMGQG